MLELTFIEAASALNMSPEELSKQLKKLHACAERACGNHEAHGFINCDLNDYTYEQRLLVWAFHFGVEKWGVNEVLASAFVDACWDDNNKFQHPRYEDVLCELACKLAGKSA